MKKILLGLGACLAFITTIKAQDIHNTQYFATPLTLNPANTGLVQCDLRASVNVRQQWNSVSSNPYNTVIASFDMATMKGKLNNGDALGVGLDVDADLERRCRHPLDDQRIAPVRCRERNEPVVPVAGGATLV